MDDRASAGSDKYDKSLKISQKSTSGKLNQSKEMKQLWKKYSIHLFKLKSFQKKTSFVKKIKILIKKYSILQASVCENCNFYILGCAEQIFFLELITQGFFGWKDFSKFPCRLSPFEHGFDKLGKSEVALAVSFCGSFHCWRDCFLK